MGRRAARVGWMMAVWAEQASSYFIFTSLFISKSFSYFYTAQNKYAPACMQKHVSHFMLNFNFNKIYLFTKLIAHKNT